MITSLLGDTFNHLLQSDSLAKEKLTALAGKSVGFDIKNSPFQLLASINPEGMEFSLGSTQHADCILRGAPIALARYMNSKQVNPSTNASLAIEIEGDLEFARKISSIFRGLDIDWEDVFSQFMGDFPAHQLSRVMSKFRDGFERSKESAEQHLQYLISERLDQVVTQDEAEVFYRQVDQAAAAAHRLEQLVNRLDQSRNHG